MGETFAPSPPGGPFGPISPFSPYKQKAEQHYTLTITQYSYCTVEKHNIFSAFRFS